MRYKNIIAALFVFILLAVPVLADAGQDVSFTQESKDETDFRSDVVTNFEVQQIRQDPYPAIPGELVEVNLRLENRGASITDPTFILDLGYPLSLDPSSARYENHISVPSGEKITLKYKLRVAEDAVAGDYEASFKIEGLERITFEYFFDVTIEDVSTDFDVIVDEITKEGVSLAISNTGDNNANSITVSIPDQTDFELLGLPSFILGNLNAGDYTILSALIAPMDSKASEADLQVRIDYTDTVGNRRHQLKTIPLKVSNLVSKDFDSLRLYALNGDAAEAGSSALGFFFYTTLILLIVAVVYIVKHRKIKKKHKK
jgi:hypothetical protein